MYSKEEAKAFKKEFWQAFKRYTKYFSMQLGEPVDWILYKTGIKNLELKFDVEHKVVRVAIESSSRYEERRFDVYAELDKYKNILQQGFDDGLIWDDEFMLPEGKVVSRAYVEMSGVKYHNRDNWPVIFKFMAENMHRLQTNFLDIEPLLKEELN